LKGQRILLDFKGYRENGQRLSCA